MLSQGVKPKALSMLDEYSTHWAIFPAYSNASELKILPRKMKRWELASHQYLLMLNSFPFVRGTVRLQGKLCFLPHPKCPVNIDY